MRPLAGNSQFVADLLPGFPFTAQPGYIITIAF